MIVSWGGLTYPGPCIVHSNVASSLVATIISTPQSAMMVGSMLVLISCEEFMLVHGVWVVGMASNDKGPDYICST